MKKQCLFIFCLPLLLLIVGFQNSTAQSIKKRQLNLYDKGGKFEFSWNVEHAERQTRKTKLRDFLRAKLSQKQLAQVTATFYTLEGDPLISNFYIEPNEKGVWIILEEWQKTCCWFYQLEKKKRKFVTTKGKRIYETSETVEAFLKELAPF